MRMPMRGWGQERGGKRLVSGGRWASGTPLGEDTSVYPPTPALLVGLCSWGFRGARPRPENALGQGRKGAAPKPRQLSPGPPPLRQPSPWSQGLVLLTQVQGWHPGGCGEQLETWDKVRDGPVPV